MQQNFGGALASQVGLVNFELNQLGDAVDKFKVALFTTFSDDAATGIRSVTDAINKLADNTELLSSVMNGLGNTLEIIAGGFLIFKLGTKASLDAFVLFADRLISFFKGGVLVTLAARFKDLGFAIGVVRTALTGASIAGVITALGAALAALAPVIAIVAGVTLALDGLIRLFTDTSLFALVGQGLDMVKNGFMDLGVFLGIFSEKTEKVTEAVKQNAHVLAFQAEQERLAAEEAAKLAIKTKAAADAAEAFQKGYDKAKNSVKDFKDEIFDSNDPLSNYQEFLADILKSSNDMAVEQVFAAKAVGTLREFLDAGLISTRAFGFAIERLNGIMGLTPFQDFIDSLDGLKLTTEEYNEFQRQLNALIEKYPELAENAAAAQDALDAAFQEDEGMANFLDSLGKAQKALSDDLATAFLEGQSAGAAFQDFFKKMVKQILSDILRLQIIQPILGSLFGVSFGAGGAVSGMTGGGLTGFLSNLIPGRASGGPVMKNRPYIVGEQGPELFMPNNSGSIVPNGGLGGQVTYNINAVDARSFKELVASDPEYLYNVTQVGARRQPR